LWRRAGQPAGSDHGPAKPELCSLRLHRLHLTTKIALRWTEGAIVEPWTRANLAAAAGLTRLLGMEATVIGTNLSSGGATLNVQNGCDGIHAALILVAAIAAFPAPLSRRLVGIAAGTLAIFGLNAVRLVNLLVVAVHLPGWLDFFHIYVWQVLIGVLAVGLFLLWGAYFARRA